MLAYLCGPIEFASDGGKLWRQNLKPFLRQELGHRVYDPAEDEKKNLTDEEAAHFRGWKTSDPARFRCVVRKIIQFDLDLIENMVDYVICHLDEAAANGTVLSGGTSAEVTIAHRKAIPVYLVAPLPPEQLSGWLMACADRVFPSVEELKRFLLERYRQRQAQLWTS